MKFKSFLCFLVIQVSLFDLVICEDVIHGRYTRNVAQYHLVVPRKLDANRDFHSFRLPHFFEHDEEVARRRRSLENDDPHLNYGLTFNGAHRYLELWPNHQFLSPDVVFEKREPNAKVQSRRFERQTDNLCYYTGRIRNNPGSKVAVSTCDGLAGFIVLDGKRYFIEPVAEHVPNRHGQHLHLVHSGGKDRRETEKTGKQCGTNENWEESWSDRFFQKFMEEEEEGSPVIRRGLESIHRYLELLIVADKKFIEFHKNTDYNTYILTIMNMVANYYHDSTAGNQMDVVVVRVMYLEKEEEEIDLTISANAEDTLASFCKWQQTVNPKDIKHPNHHDIAVLLTRYDICADNLKNCGLMGLAYVASACTGDKPCAINEDSGLILGIVVAHELGHVMGCSHDSPEESGCVKEAEDGSYHVMSPVVHLHTNIWSTCSKTFMTELFDNNLGECLNDEPQESIYKDTGMLPGAMYDAKYQCNLDFPGSSLCGGDPGKFCEKIMCRTSPKTCMSNGEPFADGTKCGENKWCYDTKCVSIGERPAAINGGWGEWGSWSDCSRTCGGGVSYSDRECNNPVPKHKGRFCLGERKKIKICNTQPCPEGSKSFRDVQCSEYNTKPFADNKLYKWEKFLKEDEPCALYCVNTDRVFSKLSPRAKDGTKCKRGTKNMCISGVCRKVGCDYVLDSVAVDDDCGICGGDGTQCKIVDEMYTGAPGNGYKKVTTIPKGSKNILIEEKAPSVNTIALSSVDEKKFFLNGDYTEQHDGNYMIGGTEGVYSHPEPNKETLIIYGPLKEDVVLFVTYFGNENVGYRYKYAEPTAEATYRPVYHWEFVEWGDCTVRCGGGSQICEPDCLEEKAGKVSPSFCQKLEKPSPQTRKCNDEPCKTKWRVGKWSKCTACKFQSGVRVREVECVREAMLPGTEDSLIDEKECPSPRPGTRELCNSHKTCAKTRRADVDGFSSNQMQHLWLQTNDDYMLQEPLSYDEFIRNRRSLRMARGKMIRSRLYREEPKCDKKEGSSNITLRVGTIVKDNIPSEEVKLIEIPLKQSHASMNLTDSAFESMGDKIPDNLDTCKQKVMTGKEAAERLKELQHRNNTGQPDR